MQKYRRCTFNKCHRIVGLKYNVHI
uniref:Uncharacterized protein n=1 Tax=Arundo donax TaxID=35708 RepID=A0A0A9CCR8_ARUDO